MAFQNFLKINKIMLKPRLFCFWTDDNVLSNDRRKALSSLSKTGLEVIFINQNKVILLSYIELYLPKIEPSINRELNVF